MLEIREGDAVTIKQIELAIVNRAWDEGWIVPRPPATRTGRTVAVIGAGPAGMACAQQLEPRGPRASPCSSATRPAAGSCASASRTSRSRSTSSSAASTQLAAEGVEFRFGVDVGGDVDAGRAARAATTRS